jgi:hypothetical protein
MSESGKGQGLQADPEAGDRLSNEITSRLDDAQWLTIFH